MDSRIQMLDRLYAMTVIIMRRALQVVLGSMHGFQSFVDVRMYGHGRRRRRCGSSGRHGKRGRGRLWSSRRGRKRQGAEQGCGDQ